LLILLKYKCTAHYSAIKTKVKPLLHVSRTRYKWWHTFRNNILFLQAESQAQTKASSLNDMERWCSRSVCCLALCRANQLVTVRGTATTIPLPLTSLVTSYVITCGVCGPQSWI
jgi:hypothetical protein